MLSPFYYLGNTRFNVNTNILLFNFLLCLTAFWNHLLRQSCEARESAATIITEGLAQRYPRGRASYLHRQSCVCKDANLRESVSQNTPPIPCVVGGELGLRFMHYEPRRAQRGLPELIILYRWLRLR